jgi:hypothetical protein
MFNKRFFNWVLVIVPALVLVSALVVLRPPVTAEQSSQPYQGRGEYQRFENQFNDQGKGTSPGEDVSPASSTGVLSIAQPGCYSDAQHAASDCDRLASQSYFQSVAPSAANCYSDKFSAASDCDRIASHVQ